MNSMTTSFPSPLYRIHMYIHTFNLDSLTHLDYTFSAVGRKPTGFNILHVSIITTPQTREGRGFVFWSIVVWYCHSHKYINHFHMSITWNKIQPFEGTIPRPKPPYLIVLWVFLSCDTMDQYTINQWLLPWAIYQRDMFKYHEPLWNCSLRLHHSNRIVLLEVPACIPDNISGSICTCKCKTAVF